MPPLHALLIAAIIAVPVAGLAQQKDEHSSHHGAAAGTAAPLIDGEVRRIDKEAKKLTIKHGPITNLDMPAMTMVFQVQDPAMLDQVKVGETIKFVAEKTGGAFTVTRIEKP